MTKSVESIEAQAMKLSSDERADLADRLWLSVHSREEIDAAWEDEIARRIAAIDAGTAELIPGDEVLAKADAVLKRQGRG